MKKLTLIALLALIVIAFDQQAMAQKFPGLDPSPADIAYFRPDGRNADPVAKVIYSRPAKKGRTMLGGTEAYGKVWRTGANETTEVKLYKDVTFGDKTLKAGTYSLYTIPDKTEWTIIFNSKLDTWGAYAYDESKDVARIKVPAGKTESEVENFTIMFDGKDATAVMILAWENTLVKIPLKY
ncbi:MAG TPA: DUF2911 domain-containing protein [Cyclobacteriaceae bacterium]|nr:DUF2911 domain-containing protein [Cyclobacteriaceae bacterium]HRJ83395.1 DUF2911 domain-containing protein [Cyclobacteriaceae bacterium]